MIPLFAQGKYPVDAWEVWRSPVQIERFVTTPYEVYVTALNGIWVWDRQNERWEPPLTIVPGLNDAYNLSNIRELRWKLDNTLTVITEKSVFERDGLWHYWTNRPLFTQLPPESTKTHNYDAGQNLEINGNVNLSGWIPPQGWTAFTNDRVLYKDDLWYSVTKGMIDDRSMMWAVIGNDGIARGSNYPKRWSYERLGPSESNVNRLIRTETGWTVAGRRTGFSIFNESKRNWMWCTPLGRRYQLSTRNIRDLAVTGSTYYLATNVGVLSGTAEDENGWKLFDDFRSNHVYSLLHTKIGLVVGTDRGVELLLPSGSVKALYEDPKHFLRANEITTDGDTVFCATTLGILQIVLSSGEFHFIEGPPGIASDDWYSIALTPNELWVGGRDGIAAQDRRSGKWDNWLSTTYFNSGSVLTIAPTDTIVWIGGTQGLFRIDRTIAGRDEKDPAAKISPRIHRYTTNDGLPSLQVNQIILDGNRLVMATEGGFCIFRYVREGKILE